MRLLFLPGATFAELAEFALGLPALTGLFQRAGYAVLGTIAAADLWGKLVAVFGEGEGVDGVKGMAGCFAIEDAGGELKAAEVVSGLSRVDGTGADCVQNLTESESDGTVIFKQRELEGPQGRCRLGFGRAAQAGVKQQKLVSRRAGDSQRFRRTWCDDNGCTWLVPFAVAKKKKSESSFARTYTQGRRKILRRKDLWAESREQRSYGSGQ